MLRGQPHPVAGRHRDLWILCVWARRWGTHARNAASRSGRIWTVIRGRRAHWSPCLLADWDSVSQLRRASPLDALPGTMVSQVGVVDALIVSKGVALQLAADGRRVFRREAISRIPRSRSHSIARKGLLRRCSKGEMDYPTCSSSGRSPERTPVRPRKWRRLPCRRDAGCAERVGSVGR
jgi:hypothetical protein